MGSYVCFWCRTLVFKTGRVAHLVLGVEDHSLGVGDSADVVLVVSGGQPHTGGKLVIEQRQLGDQPLRLLLFGRQRGQTLPDPEQGLDKLPLRTKTLRLQWTQNHSVIYFIINYY